MEEPIDTFTRAYYVDLIETRYFGSVVRENFDDVLACFTLQARIRIYHGDNPIREFHRQPQAGQTPFIGFYGHLWENYHPRFEQFRHIIDEERACAASLFVPVLTPRADSGAAPVRLSNCNLFWFDKGRIADMIIYYANPDAASV
jgi:hypothetical protein